MLSIDGQNEQKMKIARLRYASTVLTLQLLLLPASLLIISVLLFWVTVPITFGGEDSVKIPGQAGNVVFIK